jgi:hypothetical protein
MTLSSINNMPKEILIPTAWLKDLNELTESYLKTPKQTAENEEKLNLLIGFLKSVKFLIK